MQAAKPSGTDDSGETAVNCPRTRSRPCPGPAKRGTTLPIKRPVHRLREATMMILHHGWRSSASRRVRLCLAEKGLAYQGHVVDMAAMEHHSPEYLRINPLGVIPTLIHDGRPLHESGTICEYLDETFPDPPLRPDTTYERAEMRNWIRHIDARIGNLIIFNWQHHLAKTASQWTDAELAEKLKNIPSKERQEAWIRAARKPIRRKSATPRAASWSCCWTRWKRR